MPTGSCYCEKVKYEITGDPGVKGTCHCLACRKITGGTNSAFLMLPEDNYHVTAGTPKTYKGKQESGMDMTLSFCGDCGSVISKVAHAEAFNGAVIILTGTLDDYNALDEAQPGVEFYAKHRVKWVPKVEGAGQMQEFA